MFSVFELRVLRRCESWRDASALIGGMRSSSHEGKQEFIKQFLGPRAVGGFFNATRVNVNRKFERAFSEFKNSADIDGFGVGK